MSAGERPPLVGRHIVRGAPDYPGTIVSRLGDGAPVTLTVLGNPVLLGARRTALFCSARTPGDAILRAHDAAGRMRDEGVTVISGFHSPIERQCLHILLRGRQPIIVCPARGIEPMRIPAECRLAFEAARLLFVSPFTRESNRVTKDLALRRNELVAALADAACIPYFSSGGQIARIAEMLKAWKVPLVGETNR